MGRFAGVRAPLAAAAVLAAVLGLVVGCSGGAPPAGPGSAASPPPTTSTAPAVPVAYEPGTNAADVPPRTAPSAAVPTGALQGVALTASDGTKVDGRLSDGGRRWTAGGPLAYGTIYTWSGTATGPNGATSPLAGSFRTLAPASQTRATFNIGDEQTVGVAAPVEIQFDAPVQDKAAVQRALKITTSPSTEGSWAWLPDQDGGSRVHWRPKEYWTPGTKVSVAANLLGVAFGGGAYGKQDVTSDFTIGRSQIVKADTQSFRMVVIRDGKQVMDVPASYGLDSDPNRNTRSGIHVVTEKFTDKRMVSAQYGYDLMEKWAVRMSNNGEFIHANPDSLAAQGSSNVSHGCVNLSEPDAKAYYDSAMYGDPVEVTNSGVALSPRDGDIYDWAVPWDQWKAASAL